MIPRSFEYYSPRTLDEAIALLQKLGPEAKLLSGGQSLIPMMKLRLLSPEYIVDINRIPELDYISESDGHLRIGCLAREHELETSDVVKTRLPILSDTAKVIADPLVRSQATICGNLAHGDPANDHPATMMALGATVVATDPNGQREIPVADFFSGLFTTALEPEEILTEMSLSKIPGVAETLDWANALVALQAPELNEEVVGQTLGCFLKDESDIAAFKAELPRICTDYTD